VISKTRHWCFFIAIAAITLEDDFDLPARLGASGVLSQNPAVCGPLAP
jgi:hypothetical protein